MYKTITLVTALALLQASPAMANPNTLLTEEHTTQDGYEVDLYVTDGPDGELTEVTLTEPDTGESVDVWTDGTTVGWDGVADGSHVNGSALVTDLDRGPQEAPFCLTPVTAALCLGVAILFASGCFGHGCPSPGVPTNPPDSSGHNPGGGGDGEEEEGEAGDGGGDPDE